VSAEPHTTNDVEKALEEALAERNRLWAQLNDVRVDQRELEHLREELAAIRRSRMWKVVGRYRRVEELVRTALRRLRER
jgi:SepF-like predicted cell division protein (DUF552 family)